MRSLLWETRTYKDGAGDFVRTWQKQIFYYLYCGGPPFPARPCRQHRKSETLARLVNCLVFLISKHVHQQLLCSSSLIRFIDLFVTQSKKKKTLAAPEAAQRQRTMTPRVYIYTWRAMCIIYNRREEITWKNFRVAFGP